MYKIKNVRKSFKNRDVLRGITLHIEKGDVVAIVGENGAGKTTLIKIMMNILEKDSGSILFKEKEINQYKQKLYKDISAVLEGQNNLYSYINGIQNIYYFGSLLGFSKKESLKRLDSYIDSFKLRDALYKNVGDYSTGMTQKLSILVALLGSPSVLFLDEPTLGLDLASNEELIITLKNLQKERNITIILTSHETETIEKLAHKIAYLKDGVIDSYEDIDDFKLKYSSCHKLIKISKDILISEDTISFLQDGRKLYLKNSLEGNRMLRYLSENNIPIDYYGENENLLKNAILNKGRRI